MKFIAAKGFTVFITSYALLHFISYFVERPSLDFLLSILGMLTLIFAFWLLPFKRAKLQFFLILTAFIVLFSTNGSTWGGVVEGLRQMRNLVGLLFIVPMISWVLKEEPYIEEIMSFAHNFLDKSHKFYFGLMAMTQVIAHFLLFGAVPMMYRFIDSFLKEQEGEAWELFKGTAILRSFALSTMWVISIPSFIFAVEALGATLWKSILYGFLFALVGTVLSMIFMHFQGKKYDVDFTSALKVEIDKAIRNSRNQGRWNWDVIEFVFLFVSLFGTIFIVHGLWGLEFLLVIPLVIFVWTCLYFFIKKRKRNIYNDAKLYFSRGIANQAQQFSILLAAGLLIYSLNQSGMGSYVIDGMDYLTDIVPVLNILFLIPFIVIFLGFVGLGPLQAIVLVTGILEGVAFPYPPELIVLSVTSGSVISILLSPFVMPLIILSSVNGLSGVRNGLQFNLKFSILFYCVVQLYVQLVILF